MTENIVSGKKYRILTDAANDVWDRISFFTKASDVVFDDNSVLEGKSFGNAMLERSKAYAVGDVAYCASAPDWVQLYCTTAGTTAASEPSTYASISSTGVVITDGTAKFIVYDVRPTSTISANNYTPVTTGAVNSSLGNISTYVGTDGKLHFKDYTGADTALNFSSSFAYRMIPYGNYGVSYNVTLKVNDYIVITGGTTCYINNVAITNSSGVPQAISGFNILPEIVGLQVNGSGYQCVIAGTYTVKNTAPYAIILTTNGTIAG